MTSRKSSSKKAHEPSPYVSPNELATRWQCSRSSVDRIARRAAFTAMYLGEGKNGMVRYLREDILAYEESCTIRLQPESG